MKSPPLRAADDRGQSRSAPEKRLHYIQRLDSADPGEVDRDKAQTLGVPVADIFSALQTALGGAYINDFNLFGRTWQVKAQRTRPIA